MARGLSFGGRIFAPSAGFTIVALFLQDFGQRVAA